MQRLLWVSLVILALTACRPISGAEDRTSIIVTRTLATPSAATSSAQIQLTATTSTISTSMATSVPTTALTALIATETDTPLPTGTPQSTATSTPTPVATATPTAFVLPTAYTTIPSDWQIYRNEEYGFTFLYPATWTLEMPFGVSNDIPSLFLELQRPGARLMIGLKQATAVDTFIVPSGIAAGDLFEDGTVRFFKQDVPVIRLIYENQLKSVFYGRVGSEIMAGHLAFFIALSGDPEAKYIEVNLDPAIIEEVAQILTTFQLLDEVQ